MIATHEIHDGSYWVLEDGGSGTLLLESQAKDGGWSTFASYQLTRAR